MREGGSQPVFPRRTRPITTVGKGKALKHTRKRTRPRRKAPSSTSSTTNERFCCVRRRGPKEETVIDSPRLPGGNAKFSIEGGGGKKTHLCRRRRKNLLCWGGLSALLEGEQETQRIDIERRIRVLKSRIAGEEYLSRERWGRLRAGEISVRTFKRNRLAKSSCREGVNITGREKLVSILPDVEKVSLAHFKTSVCPIPKPGKKGRRGGLAPVRKRILRRKGIATILCNRNPLCMGGFLPQGEVGRLLNW